MTGSSFRRGPLVAAALGFVLAFSIVAALPSEASAQGAKIACPDRPDNEAAAKELAGEWFDKGSKMVEQEQYEEAFLAYTCSLRMIEHPDTVFNAGQAARLAGNRNMALNMFRRYTAMVPDGHMAEQAENSIREIEADIGKELEEAEKEALLAEQKEKEEAEALEREKALTEEASRRKKRKTALKVTGVISLSVGGASLVTGGVFQVLAGKAKADGETTHDFDEFADIKDKMQTFQNVAIVGFIAGGVIAGTGIALIILGQDGESEHRVSLLPGPGYLAVRGTF